MNLDKLRADMEAHDEGSAKDTRGFTALELQAPDLARKVLEQAAMLERMAGALAPYEQLARHHAADAPEWGPFDSVQAQVSIMYLRDAAAAIAAYRAQTGGDA
jgi:hypothetical protein